MSWLPLDPEPQHTLIVTHQQAKWHTHRCHDSTKADHQKLGVAQFLEISAPSPQIVGIILPLISLWNYLAIKTYPHHILRPLLPSEMAHTVVECFSLKKPAPYLSFCLSLNSVCNETSRTWASLSPETRCVISVGRLDFGQDWVLAGGFKAQSGLHHFTFFSTGVHLAMDLIWPVEHGQEWQGTS